MAVDRHLCYSLENASIGKLEVAVKEIVENWSAREDNCTIKGKYKTVQNELINTVKSYAKHCLCAGDSTLSEGVKIDDSHTKHCLSEKEQPKLLAYAIAWAKESALDNSAENANFNKRIVDAYLTKNALKSWVEWEQVQRDANIYGCLSIRIKLQLLGFDTMTATFAKADNRKKCFKKHVNKEKDNPLTSSVDCRNKFIEKYTNDDKIYYTGEVANGKNVVDYGDCIFKSNTIRNNLARQEHQRWNAYEICNGYIPASITEIKTMSKSELIKIRKHRNLTTYDGLLKYRQIIAKQNGQSEKDADVIKYDYQLMDDVVWLLKRNGEIIIEK